MSSNVQNSQTGSATNSANLARWLGAAAILGTFTAVYNLPLIAEKINEPSSEHKYLKERFIRAVLDDSLDFRDRDDNQYQIRYVMRGFNFPECRAEVYKVMGYGSHQEPNSFADRPSIDINMARKFCP